MKKIVLISVFVSSLYTYSQNPPIVPIEEWDGRGVSGTYYKDTNNVYNQFEGEWLWQSGNNSLRIILQKKEQVYHQVKEWYYEDMLVGEYQYIENGVEKINTLANINSQHNNISNSDILTTPFFMGCDDCLPNERRVYVSFSDPLADLSGFIVFKKMVVNGQQALRMTFRYRGKLIQEGQMPPPPTIPPGDTPDWDYILIKQ